jgi:hypothetical protein
MKLKLLLFWLLLFFVSPLFSQEDIDDWKISGQIQLRPELDGRDFINRTHALKFTSLRTRVGVEKTLLGKVNFFVQIQDSRVIGEEKNSLASINNIDLHQGYVTLKNLFDWDLDLQAGRFEMAYGTERFFGAVSWHYIGRAWDGIRIMYNGAFKLDIFGLTQFESAPYIGNASPSVYNFDELPSSRVFGIWTTFGFDMPNRVDLFAYNETDKRKSSNRTAMYDRYTAGLNHFGNYGIINTIIEAAYQFGKQEGFDISAYLVSASINISPDNWKFNLGTDIISGNDLKKSSVKVNTFNPALGTNHKFYGYMDYFINIPSNTMMLGLNDFYTGILLQPVDSKINASIDAHYFMSNKPMPATGTDSPEVTDVSIFGQEIDLTFRYNFIKGTTVTLGGSIFIPGELMELFFSPANDISFWAYLMITSNL